jgi:hypothetical protein
VDLTWTGAGQKLGLTEVSGRIVKSRCRSSISGIYERFGYHFPAKWIPRLVADVVCVLNRAARKGESLSLSQTIVPIGEILLFKRPKRIASSSILEMNAEWGIVVSRSFDKRYILEAYLIKSKSYGHRFKFVRAALSSFIMTIVRSLCVSSIPIEHEPEPLFGENDLSMPSVREGARPSGCACAG